MFRNATKEKNESHVQFATRLQVLWKYYMNSREINEDYDSLCELMVVDKFKDVLLPKAREFIRVKEGEEWNPVQKIARMIDIYVDDFPENGMRDESKGIGFNKSFGDKNKISENKEVEKVWKNGKTFQNRSYEGREEKNIVERRPRCWRCGMLGHISAGCRKLLVQKDPETEVLKRYF